MTHKKKMLDKSWSFLTIIRWVVFTTLVLHPIHPILAQRPKTPHSETLYRKGNAAVQGSYDAIAVSMVVWGIGVGVGIAALSSLIKHSSGSGTGSSSHAHFYSFGGS